MLAVSVFKADGYTDGNPQYMVKRWGKDGEETEYFVNPTQVQPENASYIDMLAYSTYLDITGQTKRIWRFSYCLQRCKWRFDV